jgi:hypothetical protein
VRHLLGISAYYHDSAAALLTDGERALAEVSSGGISGVDFFYEHVHLTFNGNYVLARAIAERIERVLTLSEGARWPDLAECAQRLGYTPRDTQLALSYYLAFNLTLTIQSKPVRDWI